MTTILKNSQVKTNGLDPLFNIPVAVASTVVVGQLVVQGDIIGVCVQEPVPQTLIPGSPGTYHTTVKTLFEGHAPGGTGAGQVGGTATVGAPVYIDPASGDLKLTSATGLRRIGYATRAKAAAADDLWFTCLGNPGPAAA